MHGRTKARDQSREQRAESREQRKKRDTGASQAHRMVGHYLWEVWQVWHTDGEHGAIAEGVSAHGVPPAVQQEPRGLLRYRGGD